MTKITIIGSGFVGRAWAITFARAGCDVALYDSAEGAIGAAHAYIDDVLPSLAEFDLLNGVSPDLVLARIAQQPRLAAALEGATYVQENTPENVEIKRQVFSELDRLAAPDAILVPAFAGV